jgi:hypothetical protein
MVQVMGLLQKTASQIALLNKGYSYAVKPIYELTEHANVAAGDHITTLNPKKVSTVCPLCNRTGHRVEDCWSKMKWQVRYVAQKCWESVSTPVKTGVKFLQKLKK